MSPDDPLRVLMVTPRYPPEMGGVEQHVREVATRLAHSGASVTVLTTDRTGERPSRSEDDGVSVERVRARPRERDWYFAPAIFRTIVSRRAEWDVVHVQSYHTFVAPLAMAAARFARLPYVLTFHGGGHSSRLRQAVRGPQRLVLAPFVRRAARLVAIAGFEVDLYGTAYDVPPERFELIPNGFDLPATGPLPDPTPGLIASIGRLERYKGHQRVLAALPEVLRARPDARLWIAGTGPYEDDLRQQASELGVGDRVDIRAVPPGERSRMADELARCALVVLLSEYETHPLAILEAVSLGRPALVADTSGLAELAARDLAVAIPLESSSADVAAAILRQLEAPHVPAEIGMFTWDDCAAALRRLYEQVTTGRSTTARLDARAA